MLQQVLDACCCPTEPPPIGCKGIQIYSTCDFRGQPVPKGYFSCAEIPFPTEEESANWAAQFAAAVPYNYGLFALVANNSLWPQAGDSLSGASWSGALRENARANKVTMTGSINFTADFGDGPLVYTYAFTLHVEQIARHGITTLQSYTDNCGGDISLSFDTNTCEFTVSGDRAASWLAFVAGETSDWNGLDYPCQLELGVGLNNWTGALALMGCPETLVTTADTSIDERYRISLSGHYGFPADESTACSLSVSYDGIVTRSDVEGWAVEALAQVGLNYPDAVIENYTSTWEFGTTRLELNRAYTIVETTALLYVLNLYNPPTSNYPVIADLDLRPRRWIAFVSDPSPFGFTTYYAGVNYDSAGVTVTASKCLVGIVGDNWQVTTGQQAPSRSTNNLPVAISPRDCNLHFLPEGRHVIEAGLMVFELGQMRIETRHMWCPDDPFNPNDPPIPGCYDIYDYEGGDTAWNDGFTAACGA